MIEGWLEGESVSVLCSDIGRLGHNIFPTVFSTMQGFLWASG
jgi:hypothetical protein